MNAQNRASLLGLTHGAAPLRMSCKKRWTVGYLHSTSMQSESESSGASGPAMLTCKTGMPWLDDPRLPLAASGWVVLLPTCNQLEGLEGLPWPAYQWQKSARSSSALSRTFT